MEPCYNSDIIVNGSNYHVQTEDWGDGNPFVVTKVFKAGRVVTSLKTSYQSLYECQLAFGRQAIRSGMREQHQKILDQLLTGSI